MMIVTRTRVNEIARVDLDIHKRNVKISIDTQYLEGHPADQNRYLNLKPVEARRLVAALKAQLKRVKK